MLPFLGVLIPLGFLALSKTLKELFGNSEEVFDDEMIEIRQSSGPTVDVGCDSKVSEKLLPVAKPASESNFTLKGDQDVAIKLKEVFNSPRPAAAIVRLMDTKPPLQLLIADIAVQLENNILAAGPCACDEDVGLDPHKTSVCSPLAQIEGVSGQLLPVYQLSRAVKCVVSDPHPMCKVILIIMACDNNICKLEVVANFSTVIPPCENLPQICTAVASDMPKLQCSDGNWKPLIKSSSPALELMPQQLMRIEDIHQLVKMCIGNFALNFSQEILGNFISLMCSSKDRNIPCLEVQCQLLETDTKSLLKVVIYMPSVELSVILTKTHALGITNQLVNTVKGSQMPVQDNVSQAWCTRMGIRFHIHISALSRDDMSYLQGLSVSVKFMCLAIQCRRDVYTEQRMIQGVLSILANGEDFTMGTKETFSMQQSGDCCHVKFKDLPNNETSKWQPIMWDDLKITPTVLHKKMLPGRRTLKNVYSPSRSTLTGEPLSSSSVFLSFLYLFFCPCFIIIMTFLHYILWAFFGIICSPCQLLRLTLRYFKSLFNHTSGMTHRNVSDMRQRGKGSGVVVFGCGHGNEHFDVGMCHSDEENDFQDCIELQGIPFSHVPAQDSLMKSEEDKEQVVPASSVTFWSSAAVHDTDATFFDIPQECSSATSTQLELAADSQFGSFNVVDAPVLVTESAFSLESMKLTSLFIDEVESIGTNSSLFEKESEEQLTESDVLDGCDMPSVKEESVNGSEELSGNVIEAISTRILYQKTEKQLQNEHLEKTFQDVSFQDISFQDVSFQDVSSPLSILITILSISFSLCSLHYVITILLLFSSLFRSIFCVVILLPRNILDSVFNSFRFPFCFNRQPPDSTATADVGVHSVSGGEFEEASLSQEHSSIPASADAHTPPLALPREGRSGEVPDHSITSSVDSEHDTLWSESCAVFFAFLCLCLFHYFVAFLTLLGNLFKVVLKRVACSLCGLFCSFFPPFGNQAESRTNLAMHKTDYLIDQTIEDSAQLRCSFLPMLCPCCYIIYIVSSCFFNAVNSIFKVLYLHFFRHTQ